jgi:hypothetical protein
LGLAALKKTIGIYQRKIGKKAIAVAGCKGGGVVIFSIKIVR